MVTHEITAYVQKYKKMVAVGMPRGSIATRMKIIDKLDDDLIDEISSLVFGGNSEETPEEMAFRIQKEEQEQEDRDKDNSDSDEDLSPIKNQNDPRFAKFFQMIIEDGAQDLAIVAQRMKDQGHSPESIRIFFLFCRENEIASFKVAKYKIRRNPVPHDEQPVGAAARRMGYRPPLPTGPPSKFVSPMAPHILTSFPSIRPIDPKNHLLDMEVKTVDEWNQLESVKYLCDKSKVSNVLHWDSMWKAKAIWKTSEFVSCFCDKFSSKSVPEFSSSSKSQTILLRIGCFLREYPVSLTASKIDKNDRTIMENVSKTIHRAANLESIMLNHSVKDGKLSNFDLLSTKTIPHLVDSILCLPQNEPFVVSGGVTTKNGQRQIIFLVIEREKKDFSVAIVNSGERGMEYHPLSLQVPEAKVMTVMRFKGITPRAISDHGWWLMYFRMFLVPHTIHNIQQLYESLLPVLLDGSSTIERIDRTRMNETPYDSIPRSRDNIWSTCWALGKYLLRRKGLREEGLSELSFGLSYSLFDVLVNQLESSEFELSETDQTLVRVATKEMASSVLDWVPEESNESSKSDLHRIQALIQSVNNVLSINEEKKMKKSTKFDIDKSGLSVSSTNCLSMIESHESLVDNQQPDSESEDYNVELESKYVTEIFGTQKEVKDLVQVQALVDSCAGELRILNSRLASEFKSNAGDADLLSLTAMMVLPRICAIVEALFVNILPVPQWNEPDDIWRKGKVNSDQLSDMVQDLHYVAATYLHASRGMKWSMKKWVDSKRVVTMFVIACITDSLCRHKDSFLHSPLIGIPVSVCYFSGISIGDATSVSLLSPSFAQCRGKVLEYFHQQKLSYPGIVHNVESEAATANLPNIPSSAPVQSQKILFTGQGTKEQEPVGIQDEGLFDFRRVGGLYLAPDTTVAFMCQLKVTQPVDSSKKENIWDERSEKVRKGRVELDSEAKITISKGLERLCSKWSQLPLVADFRDIMLLMVSSVGLQVDDSDPVQLLNDGTVCAKLNWKFVAKKNGSEGKLRVQLFDESLAETQPQRMNIMKTAAAPWSFLKGYSKQNLSEGNILHVPDQMFKDSLPGLGSEEAENILTILSTPTNRIPLFTSFFAEEYSSLLFEERSQTLFEAVFFEPWVWGSLLLGEERETFRDIPCTDFEKKPLLLSTQSGLLLDELKIAPEATLEPLLKIADNLVGIGQRFSGHDTESSVIRTLLFITRVLVHMQSATKGGSSEYLLGWFKRAQVLISESLLPMLLSWSRKVKEKGQQTKTLVLIHSHIVFIYSHWSAFNDEHLSQYLSSLAYIVMWSRGEMNMSVPLSDCLASFFADTWVRVREWFENANDDSVNRILSSVSNTVMFKSNGQKSSESVWKRRKNCWTYDNAENTLTINVDCGEVRVLDSPLADIPKPILNHIDYSKCFSTGLKPLHCNVVSSQPLTIQLFESGFVFNITHNDVELEKSSVKGVKTDDYKTSWTSRLLEEIPEEYRPVDEAKVVKTSLVEGFTELWRFERNDSCYELQFTKSINNLIVYRLFKDNLVNHTTRELVLSNEGLQFEPQDFSRLYMTRTNPITKRTDTYMTTSSLRGTVPDVMLNHFSWWKLGDSNVIQGYPLNPESHWFNYQTRLVLDGAKSTFERVLGDEKQVLLDWRFAREDSLLASFGSILSRLDSITNILAWETNGLLNCIELPRIHLRFRPGLDSTKRMRLFCDDLAGWCLAESDVHHFELVSGLPIVF